KNDEDKPDRQTGQARDYCEADVAESNDDSADEHKVLRAENPLPQPRTHQLSDIDRSPVGTDNSCRFRRPQGEAALVKLVEEVERQDAREAVETEPFPSLGEGHASDAACPGSAHTRLYVIVDSSQRLPYLRGCNSIGASQTTEYVGGAIIHTTRALLAPV